MLVIFTRTILIYFIVLIVIKIMGKAELSKMSPFQLVVLFMIAELASIPIESADVSMITGITAMLTLMFLQVLISFLSIKSEKLKNFFGGKPSFLIEKGKINFKEMKSLRITINDLMEQLRIGNTPSISDVEYAIMEANGSLSIIQKTSCKPVTPNDLKISKSSESLPVILISDGKIYKNNLNHANLNENQLRSELLKLGLTDLNNVFLAFSDSNSKLHIFTIDKSKKYATEAGS